MFLWVRLVDSPCPARELLPAAVEAGVAFVPGEAFFVDGSGGDRIRLSFATLTPDELGEAANGGWRPRPRPRPAELGRAAPE